MTHPTDTGTGPFELRQHSAHSALIARNAAWWGTELRLGPAIDSVALSYVDSSATRARMLRTGAADVAEGACASRRAGARARSRWSTFRAPAGRARGLAIGAWVSGEIPSLQAAWLTTIGG